MVSEQYEILKKIILFALYLSVFADIVFYFSWNKIYFNFGIPIFIMRIPLNKRYKGVPYQYLFEEEFRSGLVMHALTFKLIDSRRFFFRENFPKPVIVYYPLMHGVIVFEHDKKEVVVKGIANWIPLWITFYLIMESLGFSAMLPFRAIGPAAVIFFILIYCYLIQYYIYSKICKFSAELCSRQHFLHTVKSK